MSYRYALWRLFLRTLAARTRGSVFGLFWLFLEPFLLFLLYTWVFGVLLKVRFAEGGGLANFSAYLLAGLIPWTAFQESVLRSIPILSANRDLVVHTTFPASLLPLVEVLVSLVSELVGLVLLLLFLAVKAQAHWTWTFLPVTVGLRLLLSLGTAWLAAVLYPFWRDLEPILRMALLVGLFLTPILYPPEVIPEAVRPWQQWNPFFWLIEGYRTVLLRGELPGCAFVSFAGGVVGWTALCGFFFQRAIGRAKDFL